MQTAFMFGYWGWGNHTAELVRAIDAVEESRGYRKPVFIDVRVQRNVRARGFNGSAFENLVGKDRYIWMPSLGNQQVAEHSAGIKIKDPASVSLLLDKIVECAKSKQRVVFFCACEYPANCHRLEVGKLLLKNAFSRGIELEVIEWPGGEPSEIEIKVSPDDFKKILNGKNSIPVSVKGDLQNYAGLALGSLARVLTDDESALIVVGSVKFQSDKWVLPILWFPENQSIAKWKKEAAKIRKENKFEPLTIK
jgi:hypothetical protein